MQPKPEPADWTTLEVPYAEPEVPEEVVDQEIEALRANVAELVPIDDRPARTGDVIVIDVSEPSGESQRDLVVELGAGRLVEELERALTGAATGETKEIELPQDDGTPTKATVTLKEIKEKELPPLDDELARAASEFDTLAELRADIEGRIRDVLEEEAETAFRAAAVDMLAEASGVEAAGPLVEARTRELLNASPARSSAAASARRCTSSSRARAATSSSSGSATRRSSRSRASSCSRPWPTSSSSRSPTRRSRS